jgi:hypothetical protein
VSYDNTEFFAVKIVFHELSILTSGELKKDVKVQEQKADHKQAVFMLRIYGFAHS